MNEYLFNLLKHQLMNFLLTLLLSFDNLKEIDYNNWNGEVMTVVEVVVVSDPYVIVECN